MSSSSGTIWAQVSEDLSRVAEKVGLSVAVLQGAEGHAASGVLWQAGVIVTANHAARADECTVSFGGEHSSVAHLKGRDPSTDLAIFITEEKSGTVAPRGDAKELRVGQLVMSLARTRRGNLTASAGIISGLMESWNTWQGGQIDRFIRPDLTLYRGYSGGPLVSAKGEVVGINTTGLRRGTPISIPASTVTRVVDELLAKGHIAKPYLGIALQPVPLPANLTAKLSKAPRHGLLVVHLENDSPAAQAGIMLGDIVTEIGGTPTAELPRFHSLLGNRRVGDSVPLGILRSGEPKQVAVTLGDRFEP